MLTSLDVPNFCKSVLSKEFNIPSISSQSTMALKRKRSISSTSPSPITPPHLSTVCAHTTSASSGLSVQSPNYAISMSSHPSAAYPSYQSDDPPPQLHSRTRKRFRSKPDEASIHSINSPDFLPSPAAYPYLKIELTKSCLLLRASHHFLHPPLQLLPFQLPFKHPPANRLFTHIGPYQARPRPLLELL